MFSIKLRWSSSACFSQIFPPILPHLNEKCTSYSFNIKHLLHNESVFCFFGVFTYSKSGVAMETNACGFCYLWKLPRLFRWAWTLTEIICHAEFMLILMKGVMPTVVDLCLPGSFQGSHYLQRKRISMSLGSVSGSMKARPTKTFWGSVTSLRYSTVQCIYLQLKQNSDCMHSAWSDFSFGSDTDWSLYLFSSPSFFNKI